MTPLWPCVVLMLVVHVIVGSWSYSTFCQMAVCCRDVGSLMFCSYNCACCSTGSDHVLKGAHKQSAVGFLSLFEHYDIIRVGSFFKDPQFPIWVICSESHYTVASRMMIFFLSLTLSLLFGAFSQNLRLSFGLVECACSGGPLSLTVQMCVCVCMIGRTHHQVAFCLTKPTAAQQQSGVFDILWYDQLARMERLYTLTIGAHLSSSFRKIRHGLFLCMYTNECKSLSPPHRQYT